MTEPGQGPRFAGEAFGKGRFGGNLRRENLERHHPVETALARLVNGAHAAATEQAKDFELREKTS